MEDAHILLHKTLVDRPTQLICIQIFICQQTNTKDIAGQSANKTLELAIALPGRGVEGDSHSSYFANETSPFEMLQLIPDPIVKEKPANFYFGFTFQAKSETGQQKAAALSCIYKYGGASVP